MAQELSAASSGTASSPVQANWEKEPCPSWLQLSHLESSVLCPLVACSVPSHPQGCSCACMGDMSARRGQWSTALGSSLAGALATITVTSWGLSHMIPVTAATLSSPEGQGTATEAEGSWDIPQNL